MHDNLEQGNSQTSSPFTSNWPDFLMAALLFEILYSRCRWSLQSQSRMCSGSLHSLTKQHGPQTTILAQQLITPTQARHKPSAWYEGLGANMVIPWWGMCTHPSTHFLSTQADSCVHLSGILETHSSAAPSCCNSGSVKVFPSLVSISSISRTVWAHGMKTGRKSGGPLSAADGKITLQITYIISTTWSKGI